MLKIKNLTKSFHNRKVLDNISLDITKGETFGLVGESGCGKSTLGKIVMRFFPPDRGNIYLEGEDILKKPSLVMAKQIQMIFQDAYSSLNPRMTIYDILAEPFVVHHMEDIHKNIEILLDMIKLPKTSLMLFPHQFSGGQRQRIAIARALALRPKLIICDEPTSNLDVSIQAQILNLLIDLQKDLGLTYLFISHDFDVVRYMCDTLAVMHDGKFLDYGRCDDIFSHPKHEQTKNLLISAGKYGGI
jgi:ABC-type oligopeptide transport system ATPase subunit